MSHDVDGTGQDFVGQILNFLVNASPPKAFDVVTSHSVGAKVTGFGGHWATFCIMYFFL